MGRKSIAEIRREEIVEAFFEVVAQKGFIKATMREIAEATGCSQGMLHHYFKNKESMVLGVMDHMVTSYTAEIRGEIARRKSAEDRMRFLFSWFFDLERFDLKFSRAWMEFWVLSKTHPAISRAMTRCYKTVKEVVAGVINDGIKSREFRKVDPELMANLILGSLEGGTVLWVVDKEALPVEKTSTQRAEVFMHYLKRT